MSLLWQHGSASGHSYWDFEDKMFQNCGMVQNGKDIGNVARGEKQNIGELLVFLSFKKKRKFVQLLGGEEKTGINLWGPY